MADMDPGMERLVVGPLEVNCYLLFQEGRREALLVDPGDEAPRILERIAQLGLEIHAVLLTHGHIDHWAALPAMLPKLGAPVFLHREDHFLLEHQVNRDLAAMTGWKCVGFPVRELPAGSTRMAGMDLEVIHTPGHSPGSVVIRISDRLLTGDTLFAGGIGRSDLPGGNGRVLFDSLEKIKKLPEATKIFPGHGEESDLSREARFNPFW